MRKILIGSNPDIETMKKVRVQKYRLRFNFQVRNDSTDNTPIKLHRINESDDESFSLFLPYFTLLYSDLFYPLRSRNKR